MNPIHKAKSLKAGYLTKTGFKPFRKWAYTCPECGLTHIPCENGYAGIKSTRKTAKDALHKHMKAEHNKN